MNNLKAIRKKTGLSQKQISQQLGIAQNTYSYWENGRNKIDNASLAKLASLLDTTVDEILGIVTTETKQIKIPIYKNIIPDLDNPENVSGYDEISESIYSDGEYFALETHDISMQPRIWRGDIVIIKKQTYIQNNAILLVKVGEENMLLRKVLTHKEGLSLISLNTAYDPVFYSNAQIERLPLCVIGKVIEVRGKLKNI